MKNKSLKKDYIILFLFAFITRILAFVLNGQLRLTADEMGMLLPAASLAGRNWSGVVHLFYYYGFGYSILFTPIFMITNNPYVIYWSIMIIGAVILSLATVIGYHILKKHLKINNSKYAMFTSISCSMLALTDMRSINNEPMIVLICWTFLWNVLLLVKYNEDKKRKIIYTVLTILLLTYAFVVHNRLIVLWVSFVLLIVIYYIFHKKTLISLRIGIPFGVLLFFSIKKIISFVAKYFWSVDKNDALHNSVEMTTDTMTSNIKALFHSDNWNAALNILMGNVFTSIFFTCGIIVLAGIIIYKFLESHFCRSSTFLSNIKQMPTVNRKIETGSILFCLMLVISIAALIVQWGSLAAEGQALGYDADTSATRMFIYIRYYSCCVSLILLLFFAFVYHNKNIIKKYICGACIIFALVFIYWFLTIMPYIRTSSVGLTVFGPYGLYTADKTVTTTILHLICGIIILGLFIAVCVLYAKGKILQPIILMFLLISYRYYYNSAILQTSNEYKADGGYNFVREVEQDVELPSTIHLYMVKTRCVSYQFLLNDYAMMQVDRFPKELESGIVITSKLRNQAQRYEWGFRCIQLDENEYMWVKGDELQQQMKDYGVQFLTLPN